MLLKQLQNEYKTNYAIISKSLTLSTKLPESRATSSSAEPEEEAAVAGALLRVLSSVSGECAEEIAIGFEASCSTSATASCVAGASRCVSRTSSAVAPEPPAPEPEPGQYIGCISAPPNSSLAVCPPNV